MKSMLRNFYNVFKVIRTDGTEYVLYTRRDYGDFTIEYLSANHLRTIEEIGYSYRKKFHSTIFKG